MRAGGQVHRPVSDRAEVIPESLRAPSSWVRVGVRPVRPGSGAVARRDLGLQKMRSADPLGLCLDGPDFSKRCSAPRKIGEGGYPRRGALRALRGELG